ncbi:hypothetical protein Daus18300_011447 [Diaporthe australafricana]|uniref:Uncharacterized protein n=1 Tax=Diaporthe australafricana TaxID=127596 RepID=A0ABR3W6K0_9PEZI
MLNLFEAKHPFLVLLLCLFAFFASQSLCQETRDYVSASEASLDVLKARTGSSVTSESSIDSTKIGIPSIVLSLWKEADKKIPSDNKFLETTLDPAKDIIVTTGACYGCTVVALCSGQTCIMAHFRQDTGGPSAWITTEAGSDEAYELHVSGPIEDTLPHYEEKLGTNPMVIVFAPAGSSGKFKYPKQYSINEIILKAFPKASILNIGYNYIRSPGDLGDAKVWGKIVLEWRGSKTDCAATDESPKSKTGPSVLNVYAEESWHRSLRFDETGNPVSAASSRCASPESVENVFPAE